MKHPNYSFSKKDLPPGSKRITNARGRRVWLIGGEEYPHLRAYFTALALAKKFSEKMPDASAPESVEHQDNPESDNPEPVSAN